jgi:uncharacterized membrane protein
MDDMKHRGGGLTLRHTPAVLKNLCPARPRPTAVQSVPNLEGSPASARASAGEAVFPDSPGGSGLSSTDLHRPRLLSIDALRGVAILLMVAFHFCFDLAQFQLVGFDFYRDPFWLHLRTFVLSLFLGLVGISLVLASRNGLDRNRYWKRLLLLVLAAGVISASTWGVFGSRFVFFGVLHFIALSSVLGLIFLWGTWINLVLGVGVIAFSAYWQSPWFDQTGRRWIGLMTHRPATEDYVPLLPWFGVVLLGIFAGKLLLRSAWLPRLDQRLRPLAAARGLAAAGRHSLMIYLAHQPLLFGLLYLYSRVAVAL